MSTTVPAPSAPTLSEKEQKEKALAERLDKRGALMAASMRKFLAAYTTAWHAMMAEERAKMAVAAAAGKKGKKKKKAAAKDDGQKGKDDGKKKKVVTTPIQDAWVAFQADLDERINKAKRCTLDDVYRGVAKLESDEQRALACIVEASNNKKVLPVEGMNANSLNIREALFSAAAAFDLPVDKATMSSSSTLRLIAHRGASDLEILHQGFTEEDLRRVGRTWLPEGAAALSPSGAQSEAERAGDAACHTSCSLRTLCTSIDVASMPLLLEGSTTQRWREIMSVSQSTQLTLMPNQARSIKPARAGRGE